MHNNDKELHSRDHTVIPQLPTNYSSSVGTSTSYKNDNPINNSNNNNNDGVAIISVNNSGHIGDSSRAGLTLQLEANTSLVKMVNNSMKLVNIVYSCETNTFCCDKKKSLIYYRFFA